MAQTKTDYGLIYNDDGSVCTTVRPDQTPFPGVNSFAVETGTTNLLGSTVFDTAIFILTAKGTGTILNHLPGKGLYGSMLTRATKSDNMTEPYISAARTIQTFFIPQVGKTYTYSVYARLYGKQSNQPFYLSYHDGNHFPINVGLLTPEWKRYSYTFTVRPEYTGGTFLIYNLLPHSSVEVGSGFEICLPQLEQKPFASSFTVGSRQKGRLEIRVEDLKFDIANDDWVISYWKYPVATRNDSLNDYNTCSLGQYTSDCSKGYIWWGKEASINKYRLNVVLNDATSITNISDNTFNPTDYFYHWHYEVMKKQGKVLSYYVDGVKQCEVTIPADKELQTPFDVGLNLGGFTANNVFNPTNALIANVGNGKLKPGEFTDEHIMAIYEANRAFAQKGGVKIY